MPQYCTILCPADDPERVVSLVHQILGERSRVRVEGETESWSSITIEGDRASLELNRLIFDRPGGEFAKMQSGMWSYFDEVETKHASIKSEVLKRVGAFALAIGVVAEPGFDEAAGHFECIFGLAEELDAIIWNGSGVLNKDGEMILSRDGNSEIAE